MVHQCLAASLTSNDSVGSGLPLIDLTDRLCGRERCDTIIGNVLVYRDDHHLTATFSLALAEVLGDALQRAMRP